VERWKQVALAGDLPLTGQLETLLTAKAKSCVDNGL